MQLVPAMLLHCPRSTQPRPGSQGVCAALVPGSTGSVCHSLVLLPGGTACVLPDFWRACLLKPSGVSAVVLLAYAPGGHHFHAPGGHHFLACTRRPPTTSWHAPGGHHFLACTRRPPLPACTRSPPTTSCMHQEATTSWHAPGGHHFLKPCACLRGAAIAGAAELLEQLEAAKAALEAERRWRQEVEARLLPQSSGGGGSSSASSLPLLGSLAGFSSTALSFTTASGHPVGSRGLGLPSSGSAGPGPGSLGSTQPKPHGLAWASPEEAGAQQANAETAQQQHHHHLHHQPAHSRFDILRVSTRSKSIGSASVLVTDSGEPSPQSAAGPASPSARLPTVAGSPFSSGPDGAQAAPQADAISAPAVQEVWGSPVGTSHARAGSEQRGGGGGNDNGAKAQLKGAEDAHGASTTWGAQAARPGAGGAVGAAATARNARYGTASGVRSSSDSPTPSGMGEQHKQQQGGGRQAGGAESRQEGGPAARRGAKGGAAAPEAAPQALQPPTRAERQAQRR